MFVQIYKWAGKLAFSPIDSIAVLERSNDLGGIELFEGGEVDDVGV